MLTQRARHGFLVPGHQAPEAWCVRRDSNHDGTRGEFQDTARGTPDEHTSYPLSQEVPATPDHDEVHLQLSCRPDNFIRRHFHTLQKLDAFWSNPLLLRGSTGYAQATLCLQALLGSRKQRVKDPYRLSPGGSRVKRGRDDM